MPMPEWPPAGAPDEAFEQVADQYIAHGRSRLDILRKQVKDSPPEIRRVYARGLAEIADVVAERLAIPLSAALRLENIPWRKMHELMSELVFTLKTGHDQAIPQTDTKARDRRAMRAFGLFMFLDFLLVRIVVARGPPSRKSEASRLADCYSRLANAMAEINVDSRDPMQIQDVLSD